MIKYSEDETKNQMMNELLSLKGKKDAISKTKRKQIRESLRNAGCLSLPFSMNGNKK